MKTLRTLTIARRQLAAGFTLVELMVAMALGLLLVFAMTTVYVTSKSSFSRQGQLSALQQSVRTAFEYLGSDTRMVGHMGCFTGSAISGSNFSTSLLSASAIGTNFLLGIEGYEYNNTTTGAYTLTSNNPAEETDASKWKTNVGSGGINTIPISSIAGTGRGLTPGSDVLVIRSVSGRPVRLTSNGNVGTGQTTLSIESGVGTAAFCSNGTTSKVSGFCANSYGLIASCTQARFFQVSSTTAGTAPAASTLTLTSSMSNDPQYATNATEVFPAQTIVYYVRSSSNGTSTSLYRRVFDGDNANGLEQELIEGVESMQVRYGVDTTTPTADGIVDQYVQARGATGTSADSVTDWSRVVAVRVGLLVRATSPVEADLGAVAATGVVNGVTITYPTSGPKYDRRVFTTTMAVRNKITYF